MQTLSRRLLYADSFIQGISCLSASSEGDLAFTPSTITAPMRISLLGYSKGSRNDLI